MVFLFQFGQSGFGHRGNPAQRLEQVFVFLGMVEALGKGVDIIHDGAQQRGVKTLTLAHGIAHRAQNMKDTVQITVLRLDDLQGAHGR